MSIFSTLIDQTAKKAAEANPPKPGDYIGANNLLYCGICNTPKQTVIPGWGGRNASEVVPCNCSCKEAELQQEIKERERETRIVRLRESAFDHRAMLSKTFDNDNNNNPQLTEAMRRFCAMITDKPQEEWTGLLLWGNKGIGKSYAAAEVVNELVNNGIPAKMVTFARIRDEKFSAERKAEYMDRLISTCVLAIDDFGAEGGTQYMNELVYEVIDARCRTGLPLIVTTNLTIDEIKNAQSDTQGRVCDRILEMCHPIHVEGKSQRRQQAAERYADMKDYFGM